MLEMLFLIFSGTISADEIREVLRKSGEDVDEAEIEEMLKLVDVDGDGNISIEGAYIEHIE
jgi:calmodulin